MCGGIVPFHISIKLKRLAVSIYIVVCFPLPLATCPLLKEYGLVAIVLYLLVIIIVISSMCQALFTFWPYDYVKFALHFRFSLYNVENLFFLPSLLTPKNRHFDHSEKPCQVVSANFFEKFFFYYMPKEFHPSYGYSMPTEQKIRATFELSEASADGHKLTSWPQGWRALLNE